MMKIHSDKQYYYSKNFFLFLPALASNIVYKFLPVLFFFFLLPNLLRAQILPAEGSKLNYRIIGFKFPPVPHAGNYKIEIAKGNCFTEESFKQNIIETLPVKKNKIIAEVPFFDAEYTWQCSYSVRGVTTNSSLHHFSTTFVPEVDTNITRLRIMQPALQHKDCYVFLDGNRALYDMNGNPVWYLPNISWSMNAKFILGDLKLSSHNTITYHSRGDVYEINYEGDILWKAPIYGKVSGDGNEHYHHEFTRLDNGNYMVLGSETKWKFPSPKDSLFDTCHFKNRNLPVEFGTLIEYDEKGNVVWSWKSSKYFLEEDTNFIKPITRYCPKFDDTFIRHYDYIHPGIERLQQDVHENAFYFDEKNNAVYL